MNQLGRYNFFRNYDSGAPHDSENAARSEKAIANFQKYIAGTKLESQFTTNVTKSQLGFERVFFPLAGLALGVITARMFVRPSSFYIGKFWAAGLTGCGYYLANRRQDLYNTYYYAGNFDKFPEEIRMMLRTGDSRYAREWWLDERFEQKLQNRAGAGAGAGAETQAVAETEEDSQ